MKRFEPTALLLTAIVALVTILWYYVNFSEHRMENLLITNFSSNSFDIGSIQISLKEEAGFRTFKKKLEGKDAKTISKMNFGFAKEIDTFKINIFGKDTILTKFNDITIVNELDTQKYISIKFYRDSTYRDIYRVNITDGSPTTYFKTFVFMNRSYSLISVSAINTSGKKISNFLPWPDNRDIKLFPNPNKDNFDKFDYFLTDVPKENQADIKDNNTGPRDPSAGIGVELGNSVFLTIIIWIIEILIPSISALIKLLIFILV